MTNPNPITNMPHCRLNAVLTRLAEAGVSVDDGEAILRLPHFAEAVAEALAAKWERPGLEIGPFSIDEEMFDAVLQLTPHRIAKDLVSWVRERHYQAPGKTHRLVVVSGFELGFRGNERYSYVTAIDRASRRRGLLCGVPIDAVAAAFWSDSGPWCAIMLPFPHQGQNWAVVRTAKGRLSVAKVSDPGLTFTERDRFLFARQ